MRDNLDTSICLGCSCNVCGSSWHLSLSLLQSPPIDSLSECRKIHSCATGHSTVDTCAFGVRFCMQSPIVVDLCCKKRRFLAPSSECVCHKCQQLFDCMLIWCLSFFEEHALEDKSCTTTRPLCTHSRSLWNWHCSFCTCTVDIFFCCVSHPISSTFGQTWHSSVPFSTDDRSNQLVWSWPVTKLCNLIFAEIWWVVWMSVWVDLMAWMCLHQCSVEWLSAQSPLATEDSMCHCCSNCNHRHCDHWILMTICLHWVVILHSFVVKCVQPFFEPFCCLTVSPFSKCRSLIANAISWIFDRIFRPLRVEDLYKRSNVLTAMSWILRPLWVEDLYERSDFSTATSWRPLRA